MRGRVAEAGGARALPAEPRARACAVRPPQPAPELFCAKKLKIKVKLLRSHAAATVDLTSDGASDRQSYYSHLILLAPLEAMDYD